MPVHDLVLVKKIISDVQDSLSVCTDDLNRSTYTKNQITFHMNNVSDCRRFQEKESARIFIIKFYCVIVQLPCMSVTRYIPFVHVNQEE